MSLRKQSSANFYPPSENFTGEELGVIELSCFLIKKTLFIFIQCFAFHVTAWLSRINKAMFEIILLCLLAKQGFLESQQNERGKGKSALNLSQLAGF